MLNTNNPTLIVAQSMAPSTATVGDFLATVALKVRTRIFPAK